MEHASGCLICGADLLYAEAESRRACFSCGAEAMTSVACDNGHFVCDSCHSASANDLVERYCAASSSREPLQMAITLMRDPRLKMHGPEHHFLTPAVLLAAYCNSTGRPAEEKERLIGKARTRAEEVKGGSCGFNGACGAGVGTGIFMSLATGATPVARAPWRLANLMTSESLHAIAIHGGPRCCKRDTFLAIRAAVSFARRELRADLPDEEEPRCEWSARNRECLGAECPFSAIRRAP